MIGGTLASAAPTPGGVGAVEAALIGGLAAFGLDSQIAVPSVLLYRVLTCWRRCSSAGRFCASSSATTECRRPLPRLCSHPREWLWSLGTP